MPYTDQGKPRVRPPAKMDQVGARVDAGNVLEKRDHSQDFGTHILRKPWLLLSSLPVILMLSGEMGQ